MHAALQQYEDPVHARSLRPRRAASVAPSHAASAPTRPRRVAIQGITADGKTFRPGDWAERLAGALACFRPGGAQGGIGAYIGYSPYCVPRTMDGVNCVLVSEELKDVELLAWEFVISFARDNTLRIVELAGAGAGFDAPPTATPK